MLQNQTPLHVSLNNFVARPWQKRDIASLAIWSKSCPSDFGKMVQQQNYWEKRARGMIFASFLQHDYKVTLN